MTAYFTEPLGDEFRKAIEEAMSEINSTEENNNQKKPRRRESPKKKIRRKTGYRRSASRATKPQ